MNEAAEDDEPLPPLTPEHRERVTRALDLIEQAQLRMNEAAELLSPVPGLGDEWQTVRGYYFTIKECWHKVRDGFRLQSARSRTSP
jgi:hypothetical protein